MNSPAPPSSMPPSASLAAVPFDNLFARELPEAGVFWPAHPAPAPRWLFFNAALAEALGLDLQALSGEAGLKWWSGVQAPPGSRPMAQAYSGHQFGGFSPVLGDGRALLLGDFVAPSGELAGQRFDVALKGSGPTPFARRGDGKAAVAPMLREVLIGESLHAMGVPTTRVLAVVATGESIRRERPLPGAVMTRVAASHLRVGSFQYAASQGEVGLLRRMWQHAMARHDPELLLEVSSADLALDAPPNEALLLRWFGAVLKRQAQLVAHWMSLGFIHGVMNTDNMAISGQSIDFGPCAFMESFDPLAVFSSIDQQGRYAWGRQPAVAQWNLARLAEAMLPLFSSSPEQAAESLSEALQGFVPAYVQAWRSHMAPKFGLTIDAPSLDPVIDGFLKLVHEASADYHWALRHLADLVEAFPGSPACAFEPHGASAAALHPLWPDSPAWREWLALWRQAMAPENFAQAGVARALATCMRASHPLVIPRSQWLESALSAAQDDGNLQPFDELLEALRQPWRPEAVGSGVEDPFVQPSTSAHQRSYQTFCGT